MNERQPFDGSQVRAVAFDGYGTLLRFHDDEFRTAVTEILGAQQLEHDDHEAVYGTLMRSFFKAGPWADHVDGEGHADYEHLTVGPLPPWISTWEIWRRQWTLTFDAHDLGGDPDHAANHFRERLAAAEAYPDAHDTIERLAAGGLRVGLLSNADEDFLQSAVSRAGLRFSVIQSSESLRAYKPNRVVFDALCHRLGCDPSEVLYVGDSIPTDVQGAHYAGLRTAWIQRSDREPPADLPAPDLRLTALSELPALIDTP